MSHITLLGPQRYRPSIAQVLEELNLSGPLAVITAGWQERESEVDELRRHVGRSVTNLQLHRRAETVFDRSPKVFQALRQRQQTLKRLQRLHRIRLDYALEPARKLLRRKGPPELLEPEREAAVAAVRELDAHHRRRLGEIHQEFEQEWGQAMDRATRSQRQKIRKVVEESDAVAIAGGHVAVLLNRLRLFRLEEMMAGRPIVAWSAGAMALTDSVVLFHDRPPQGAGNAEILDLGLGLCSGVVVLPHASQRLRLDDPVRVALFARRFAPARSVTLDPGARLSWDGSSWTTGADTPLLAADGSLETVESW
ncbi:MAG: Type 1 glutamine amidotransferase-like domain-containing protein [Acidobacteriota bacterium]|nr:Type 1 glutamine amidotransferase-like domain-containing protein [Acidobacteriota bacterium]